MRKVKNILYPVWVSLALLWTIEGVAMPLSVDTLDIPEFLHRDKNGIVFNGADWSPLFAEMKALRSIDSVSSVVSVVHIGDSHLQAGFFTEAVRVPLQRDFGNAGRGLVIPLKMAKTNEPRDYSIIPTGTWDFSRCVGSKNNRYTPGIGGVAVVPATAEEIGLTISTLSKEDNCNGFRTIRLFHTPIDSFPGIIAEPFQVSGKSCTPFLTQFSWEEPVCSVSLLGRKSETVDTLAIYGASLETGEKGILYHTIGNNGAFYRNYAGIPRFAEQVAALSPRLIVVSLGTNESFLTTLTREELYGQIDKVVLALRQESPEALILLTTPAECARRRVRRVKRRRRVSYLPNSRVELVCETIRSYACDHELAYWDWYEVAGGKGSSADWCKGGYMAKDRTHCSESGYRVQGEMLYRTLMNAYQDYVERVAQ